MSVADPHPPGFSEQDAGEIARRLYDIASSVRQFPSYIDQNFHLKSESGQEFVLKIANSAIKYDVLDLQNSAMNYLSEQGDSFLFPRVHETTSSEQIATVESDDGVAHFVRLVTYLPGTLLADVNPHTPELLRGLGCFFGTMDKLLEGFQHEPMCSDWLWDLKNANSTLNSHIKYITNPERRAIVEHFLRQFEAQVVPILPNLRMSFIHNDGNDYNVLVADDDSGDKKVAGIVDFGDISYTHTVFEVAIAAAYAMLEKADPITAAAHIVGGYHKVFPLTELELELLYILICMRMCVSVTLSAYHQKLEPDNEYLLTTEEPGWALLEQLIEVKLDLAHYTFRHTCQLRIPKKHFPVPDMSREETIEIRNKHVAKSLSIAYKEPLKIVRGFMQYLYDDTGRAYLDVVNNVCHVGHCHPRVVKAAQQQMAVLNTNTRYLHDNLVRYAQRLVSTMPEPLSVCFFVCTGSEANELALRLARTHTKKTDFLVIDGAYHGNTNALIEISPYKFDGPGGSGVPPNVHKVVMPDGYRGIYKSGDRDAGVKYANHARESIRQAQQQNRGIAAFIGESLLGCGGQIVLPDNYFREVYRHVREAGGVCIADEVQIGFGRVGSHFWGFETQSVIPDIVTLGKPIGNGHPLAAVVTTPEIAASFDNGMEYFNTFGGNPVSCAVGLAVLDVVKDENLQENALKVGAHMKAGLERLMAKYPLIGDVRGFGLFIGIELVLDRETLTPAAAQASYIVERMKEHGILLSIDGPLHNVLKIKPPLVFSEPNADFLVNTLDKIMVEDALQ